MEFLILPAPKEAYVYPFHHAASGLDQCPTQPQGATLRLELWWSLPGSIRRPPACKAGALPTELRPRLKLAPQVGIEPTTFGFGGRRAANCATGIMLGSGGRDRTYDLLVNSQLLLPLSYSGSGLFYSSGCGTWIRTKDLTGYEPGALPLCYTAISALFTATQMNLVAVARFELATSWL